MKLQFRFQINTGLSQFTHRTEHWNTISGPWLVSTYNATGPYNPYSYAPTSAHILWSKVTTVLQEGLAGGQYGSLPFAGTAGVTGALENDF